MGQCMVKELRMQAFSFHDAFECENKYVRNVHKFKGLVCLRLLRQFVFFLSSFLYANVEHCGLNTQRSRRIRTYS
jgi:hypothetical protein